MFSPAGLKLGLGNRIIHILLLSMLLRRNIFVLFILCFIFLGCNKKKKIKHEYLSDYFVFSYNIGSYNHSIKFTNSDTIFIRKCILEKNNIYYGIISEQKIDTIKYFINELNKLKFSSIYNDKYLQDGESYKFYLVKGDTINSTFIYGRKAPKRLYEFAKWLMHLERKVEVHPIDKIIDFGNLKGIVLPVLPSEVN